MHVTKPAREQTARALATAGNEQTRVSDQATISYFVSGMATGTMQQAASGPGLARLEGDRLVIAMADQQSNAGVMAAHTEIVAPEVISLVFMYFDGFAWRSDWDSSVMKGLPLAIDVEMTLTPMAQNSRGGMPVMSTGTANVYRLVIAIPLAKPMDTSTITLQ